MHWPVIGFLHRIKRNHPDLFSNGRVLECGSYDINGSPRVLFDDPSEYIGLDWRDGPGVDVVSLAHEYKDKPDGYFDLVISTEMLEHDPYWKQSIKRMVDLLSLGGSMLITCAGPSRKRHSMESAPDLQHYKGIGPKELSAHVKKCSFFDAVQVEERNHPANDVYLFAKGKRTDSFLSSIVILTYNGLEHTKACLDSIERNTPEAHEIILIDNNSADDTVAFLREYRRLYANVRVVENKENMGFGYGCNQGMALAHGDFVVLLNNDTVVSEGWLSGMLNVFGMHPECGLVGPMSNYVAGQQMIPQDFPGKTLDDLTEFSDQWQKKFSGQTSVVPVLIGFCLAISYDVIRKIGGLDTQFFPGNYEDFDYCYRAVGAGFECRIAREVFVYHVGHVAFDSDENIDAIETLKINRDRFISKWNLPNDSLKSIFDLKAPSFDLVNRVLLPDMIMQGM
jgi:GT2 family glycosyltransferase